MWFRQSFLNYWIENKLNFQGFLFWDRRRVWWERKQRKSSHFGSEKIGRLLKDLSSDWQIQDQNLNISNIVCFQTPVNPNNSQPSFHFKKIVKQCLSIWWRIPWKAKKKVDQTTWKRSLCVGRPKPSFQMATGHWPGQRSYPNHHPIGTLQFGVQWFYPPYQLKPFVPGNELHERKRKISL